jgi:hypothetical protein
MTEDCAYRLDDTGNSRDATPASDLDKDQEAFVSWFVDWWRRRGRHLDFDASDVSTTDKKSSDPGSIEIWRGS